MLLPSNHEIRCFRSSCQCFVIINQWFSLFSQFLPMFSYHHTMMQFLPMFSYHQTLIFAVFAIPASVVLSSNHDSLCFRNSSQRFVIIKTWFPLFSQIANVWSQLIHESRCFRSSCQSSFIKPCNSLFSQFLPTFPDHQAMASL